MSGINQKKPTFCLMLLLIVMFVNLPLIAAEKEVGKTLLTRGDVTAQRDSGVVVLKRRSIVFERDEIHVGDEGRAQLRMVDQALISLQENSVLQIKNYQYQKGGKNNSALLELLSGGLRTITGAIGKGDKKAYELRTPLATIGIRGTDYEVEIVSNGMYVAVWDGVIHLRARLKNGCNMLIGRAQPFMFIFIDRLGKCKGLYKVPDVFKTGHSSNITLPRKNNRSIVGGLQRRRLVIEPLIQTVPDKPVVTVPPVVVTPPATVTPPPVTVTPPPTTITPPPVTVVVPPTIVIPPPLPVVTFDFSSFAINQLQPTSELDTKATAIDIDSPTFKVGGLNLLDSVAGTISDFQQIDGYPVSWGYWGDFTTSLASKSVTNTGDLDGLIWAVYESTKLSDVMRRTGTFNRFNNVSDSLVAASAGALSNLKIQMDVNFSDGVVTNGALSANTTNETWVAVFDGTIKNGDLDLNLNGASLINSDPSLDENDPTRDPRDASGFIAGDFIGDEANAVVGAFGLSENGVSTPNHIEGVFILKEAATVTYEAK